jgi:hypothetical protein
MKPQEIIEDVQWNNFYHDISHFAFMISVLKNSM